MIRRKSRRVLTPLGEFVVITLSLLILAATGIFEFWPEKPAIENHYRSSK